MSRSRVARLAACGATMIWGINYSVGKRVLTEVDPLGVAFLRALVAALFFGILLVTRDGAGAVRPSALRRALLPGLLGIFGNQVLFIEGLKRTSAAHSAICVALTPLFVLILSVLLGEETVTAPKVVGILVALLGISLVALERGIDVRSEYLRGDLLTLMAVLAFAGYTVTGKPVLRELGPLRATALVFLTGGAGIVIVGLPAAGRQGWTSLSRGALFGLGYMVVLGTIVAYLLYYFALDRIDPSQLAVFTYLQPVVGALTAYAFTGEGITPTFLAGGALVLTGVAIADS